MANPIPDANLDRWEALADAATPGPWCVVPTRHGWHVITSRTHADGTVDVLADDLWREADAAHIAASREAVPALVAEVRRLREEVARLSIGVR